MLIYFKNKATHEDMFYGLLFFFHFKMVHSCHFMPVTNTHQIILSPRRDDGSLFTRCGG